MDENKIIENNRAGVSEIASLMEGFNTRLTNHIDSLNQELQELRIENKILYARIGELEAKLNKNSNNSSKPPSSINIFNSLHR